MGGGLCLGCLRESFKKGRCELFLDRSPLLILVIVPPALGLAISKDWLLLGKHRRMLL